MGFNKIEQEKYDRYMSQLRTGEPEALAAALSTMMLFNMFSSDLLERIISDVKENTRIIRHNRRVTTRNNKMARLRELSKKKRYTQTERIELKALYKVFDKEIQASSKEV